MTLYIGMPFEEFCEHLSEFTLTPKKLTPPIFEVGWEFHTLGDLHYSQGPGHLFMTFNPGIPDSSDFFSSAEEALYSLFLKHTQNTLGVVAQEHGFKVLKCTGQRSCTVLVNISLSGVIFEVEAILTKMTSEDYDLDLYSSECPVRIGLGSYASLKELKKVLDATLEEISVLPGKLMDAEDWSIYIYRTPTIQDIQFHNPDDVPYYRTLKEMLEAQLARCERIASVMRVALGKDKS